jgi:uncharacterized protein YoxC
MNSLLELLKNNEFAKSWIILNIILIIVVIALIVYVIYLNKKYLSFMKKMGNGNNLDEMLKKYLADINQVKQDNSEIKAYYTKLDNDISSSIQKIGLVRYNAFKDVGSDLSFAIALLDREDNGVVFNGIYGSESSNIYAKPIKNGESSYQLSDEEKYAIEIAEQNKNFVARRRQN